MHPSVFLLLNPGIRSASWNQFAVLVFANNLWELKNINSDGKRRVLSISLAFSR
jgi:hypothetical protein